MAGDWKNLGSRECRELSSARTIDGNVREEAKEGVDDWDKAASVWARQSPVSLNLILGGHDYC
jgi:hypothetical protein